MSAQHPPNYYHTFRTQDAEAVPQIRFGGCEDGGGGVPGHPFDCINWSKFTRPVMDINFIDTCVFAKYPDQSKKLNLLRQRMNYWAQQLHSQARSSNALSSGVFWGVKPQLVHPPLHSHPTSFINLQQFLHAVNMQETAVFTFLNKELSKVNLDIPMIIPSSSISKKHVEKLLLDKVIIHCDKPICGGLVKVTLEKIGTPKERLRFLGDLFQTNFHLQNLADHVATKFTSPSTLLQQIFMRKCTYAASFDMKSYYQQIPLPPGFERFCSFQVAGKHYAFNSLPMGLNLSVPMAHSLTGLCKPTRQANS